MWHSGGLCWAWNRWLYSPLPCRPWAPNYARRRGGLVSKFVPPSMCTVDNIYITAHHILILCIYIYNIYIYIIIIFMGKLGKLRRPHCDLTGRMVSRGNDTKRAWFREACWQLALWFCVFLYFSFCLLCGVGWGWDGVRFDVNFQLKLIPILMLGWV